MKARHWLRVGALGIAVLGLLDPSVATQRFARAEVGVVATEPVADSALVAAVVRRLHGKFRVLEGGGPSDATVLVGDRLPPAAAGWRGPLVSVLPTRPARWLAIERVDAPTTLLPDERATVSALVHLVGAKGRIVDVALRHGERIVARRSVPVATADARLPVSLPFVATSAGAVRLRVTAELSGGGASAADLVVDVRPIIWDVLAFDLRPSWQATFVRRALEADPRLSVTSRVIASPGISRSRGSAPQGLDAASLARYQVVVIGAPALLTPSDVTTVEAFLRNRGGRVVVLLDAAPSGPMRRLVGGGAWQHDSGGRVIEVVADSSLGRLRGASFTYPNTLPLGADVLATAAGRPVLWRTPVGDGEVVVVGAPDAWQRRSPSASDFGRLWPTLVAELAAAASPPLELALDRTVLRPGDSTLARVTLRDVAAGQAAEASVAAELVAEDGGRRMVRLWPGLGKGTLVGTVRPPTGGSWRLVVARGSDSASAPLLADPRAALARPDGRDLLAALVAGGGGAQLTGDNLARLPDVVQELIGADPTPDRWHPMRSPWWILPFAFLLATEWWLRRRAGDA